MSFKKYMVFIIASSVAMVLLIAAGIKLVSSLRAFEREKRGLHGSSGRLQQLHYRNPYPSQENVRKESENASDLFQAYSSLNDMLMRGQIEPENMEAADFMPLLENTLRRMRNRLQNSRIMVPENFSFSFERYAGGQLPVPEDIPRLVQQLKIIEMLNASLTEVGVTELVMITREIFETPEAAARTGRAGRRGAPEPEEITRQTQEKKPDGPYSSQVFKMAFRAREHVVFELLNNLASHPMFCVVTSVIMSSRSQDAKARQSSRTAPLPQTELKAGSETTKRGQRILFRQEDIEIELNVEVYQFSHTEKNE